MIEAYYSLLSTVFAPILSLPSFLAELVLAGIITFLITLFYKYMVDQNKVKQLKADIKAMQEKIKEAQKSDPKEANKMMGDMFKLTNQQMILNFKPMLPAMVIVFALLPWMAKIFISPIVQLPFSLPFFGNDFGWLMWYLIISIPLTQLFRKALGVE